MSFASLGMAGLGVAQPALAWAEADAAAEVERLDKSALEAYDNLNFEQARKQLSQALDLCDSQGLGPELTAKTHLYLGMVLIAAFSEKSEARLHFQSALKLKRDISAPKSLFNPEAQALFEEVKASAQESGAQASSDDEENQAKLPPPVVRPRAPTVRKALKKKEEEGEVVGAGVFLSLGGGFGFGVANSQIETNSATLVSGGGNLTAEKPLHLFAEIGYSVSPELLISLQARLGFLAGTTQVNAGGDCKPDAPCQPPTTAFAGLAKATWFFGPEGKVVPFVAGGLGGGLIRHVVKIKLNEDGMGDCGADRMSACVDTVKGGPFLLAAGGGLLLRATENVGFSLALMAEVGLPNTMLNADLNGGVALQF